MKTWLLTWNPGLMSWDDGIDSYNEMLHEVETVHFSYAKWTCGTNKSIMPGDRIFLIRLGVAPKGMVASGYAISPVFEGTHWNPEKRAAGKKARRIYIKFDKMLDIDKGILEMDELKQIGASMHWSSQCSGISIPEETASKLEQAWEQY